MQQFKDILTDFDRFLSDRGLVFTGTVVGGAALQLLSVIDRPTKDCDVLEPIINETVKKAAQEFAIKRDLAPDWLNNGPATLTRDLPVGWELRRQEAFKGRALYLYTLGREDLLRSKLFAYLDRGIDLSDLRKLKPTEGELITITPWLLARDGNQYWPQHVKESLDKLRREL
jgi:hypothetical protein